MSRYGPQYGPDITFRGMPRCTWDEPDTYADADVVILGAPFDGGTSHRPGTRFGPQHIRQTCYLPHDGSRPSLALRVDGLSGDLTVYDAGDVEMYSGDAERSVRDLQRAVRTVTAAGAVPLVLGGDHTIAWPDAAGVAQHLGQGRISMIHFDAHEECLTEAFSIAMDDCDGVFLSVDIDVCDPGHAPGTGTPEPGGLTARQLLDAVRRIAYELPVVDADVVEVSPAYDHADITSALANRVVLEVLSGMARRRRDTADGSTWDPLRPLLDGR